ncbi:transposition helper protein [Xanthomonas citri pv. aurantifolii str. ICPB 10535]|nr:transposition helper protein [Xanthomonas citri pv. aurantifolii str. ICPB 10535]
MPTLRLRSQNQHSDGDRRVHPSQSAFRFEVARHPRDRNTHSIFEQRVWIDKFTHGRSVCNVLSVTQLAEESGIMISVFATPRAAVRWNCHPDIRWRSLSYQRSDTAEDRCGEHCPFASESLRWEASSVDQWTTFRSLSQRIGSCLGGSTQVASLACLQGQRTLAFLDSLDELQSWFLRNCCARLPGKGMRRPKVLKAPTYGN